MAQSWGGGGGGRVSTSTNEGIQGHGDHSGEVMSHGPLSKKSSPATRHSGNHRDGVNEASTNTAYGANTDLSFTENFTESIKISLRSI